VLVRVEGFDISRRDAQYLCRVSGGIDSAGATLNAPSSRPIAALIGTRNLLDRAPTRAKMLRIMPLCSAKVRTRRA